ncbi:uncharacterized protein [Anabrus simplex]|uniref:uncharacterized protein n=1 Tax=Anabrus simplex TaxID=316456 RepID=UPI0034DD7CF7
MPGHEDWLTMEFLEEVLRQIVGDPKLTVTRGDVKAAVAAGENFGSVLYRATTEYTLSKRRTTQTYTLIIKTLPCDGIIRQMLELRKFFTKEIFMYRYTIPEMYETMQKYLSPGTSVEPIAPKEYPCSLENTIVLEDLRILGYKVADRRKGLNLEHCLVVMKQLAVFHAMSFALYKRNPQIMFNFQENMYTEDNRHAVKGTIEPGLKVAAEVVETWEGFERFGSKIRKLAETAVDRLLELIKPEKDKFQVLNHGDLWVNNILFQYSFTTGEVMTARFIDFQMSRFVSPALDLQYFLHTSPCEVVRTRCVDQLLQCYHSKLDETLRTLKCEADIISLEQLTSDMNDKDFVGLLTSLTVLHIVLADKNALKPASTVDISLRNMYSAPRYKQALQKVLIHYEEKGMI